MKDGHLQNLFQLLLELTLICCCSLQAVHAECNVCAVNNPQACVSETEFQICTNGVPSGTIFSCNPGQICSLTATCQNQNDTNAILACGDCDVCNADNTFACLGTREFALCLGVGQPSVIRGVCEVGLFCNINNPYICGTPESGYPATCPYTADPTIPSTTPTPSPATDPNSFCSALGERGRYPVGTNPATTCRQYAVCIQRNDNWIGALYYCPNNFYFDDVTRACIRNPPTRCNTRIRSLSIDGIELI